MKSGKKPLTKNLVYSNFDLTDEESLEDSPLDPRRAPKPVKKMRDRTDVKGFKSRGGTV
ncbi:MAG: hypothetical protein V4714_07350 [Bacteroidota bacterium]